MVNEQSGASWGLARAAIQTFRASYSLFLHADAPDAPGLLPAPLRVSYMLTLFRAQDAGVSALSPALSSVRNSFNTRRGSSPNSRVSGITACSSNAPMGIV